MDTESRWQVLEQLLSGVMSLGDFERWLGSTSDLESALGTRAYGQIQGFDFRQQNADLELHKLVRSIYESARPGRLARDRAFRIARGLINGSVRIQDGVSALAQLCLDGHDWVPGIFVSAQWEFDKIPKPEDSAQSEPAALAAKLEEGRQMVRFYQPSILDAAREIIASYQKQYGG
jgi:hypothetical protein